jgi:hypothetical protein
LGRLGGDAGAVTAAKPAGRDMWPLWPHWPVRRSFRPGFQRFAERPVAFACRESGRFGRFRGGPKGDVKDRLKGRTIRGARQGLCSELGVGRPYDDLS